jgi:hypothetical protein
MAFDSARILMEPAGFMDRKRTVDGTMRVEVYATLKNSAVYA